MPDWVSDFADATTILATLLGVGGLIIAIHQLRRIATATVAAETAAKAVLEALTGVDARSGVEGSLRSLKSARSFAFDQKYHACGSELRDARLALMEARANLDLSDDEQRAFQEAVSLVTSAMEAMNTAAMSKAGPSAKLITMIDRCDHDTAECLSIAKRKVAANAQRSVKG
ncbi:hypothetical protein [Marinicauda sp. Alg238-R41]|jgi:hypothetical protein|uniref:hypothetical protein n=1 Tax=Marinicauda sp. Alg238-R41 TaxID=2993447 RepID=UPI0022DF67A9|nr:hypothetical protein [Marinicauda sp. Alg238-R41]